MKELRGRVAVVTGAASGIGFGLAERFAQEGMKVVLADVEAGALDDAVERITSAGGEAIGVRTDVTDESSVQALADRAVAEYGGVNLLVNNAGVSSGAPFEDFAPETFAWVINVNMWGVIHGCRVFLPILAAQDEAHIVNTSSTVTALGYMPTGAAYTTSKAAVSGFTEQLFREFRMSGSRVGVSLLIPGGTDTRIINAERNLPEGAPSMMSHPTTVALYEQLAQGGEGGLMPPSEVAAKLVDGLAEGRFHIFTEPEVSLAAFQARVDWMRTGEVPPPSPVLEPWSVVR